MSEKLRFYFDESVELAVSEQIARAGIEAVSAHSLNALGDDDVEHLRRATGMGCVLCTYDSDFLILASQGVEHTGILFAVEQETSIGDWVREIRSLHATTSAEQVNGQVLYVSRKRPLNSP